MYRRYQALLVPSHFVICGTNFINYKIYLSNERELLVIEERIVKNTGFIYNIYIYNLSVKVASVGCINIKYLTFLSRNNRKISAQCSWCVN